jgi:acetolactate synthase-1/2/3 large subunit
MIETLRSANIVVRTLERAGLTEIFTLSGNHIMSLFDAAIDRSLRLMHVRHEAATVHMAEAHEGLTGGPGIAWVTGRPRPTTPTPSARYSPRSARKPRC